MFVRDSLSQTNILENIEFENSNFLVVKLISTSLTLIGVYKPPDANIPRFLTKLDYILEKYANSIVFGDFNINLFDRQNNHVLNYKNTVNSNGFKIFNSCSNSMFTRRDPTRNSKTCIDYISTDCFLGKNFYLAIDNILNVDHQAIFLSGIDEQPDNQSTVKKFITVKVTNHDRIVSSEALSTVAHNSFEELVSEIQKVFAKNTLTIKIREKFRKPLMDITILN